MSQTDPQKNGWSLPLHADPASAAIVGTFLLAMCLAGPFGLVLALVAWILIDALRRSHRGGIGSPSDLAPRDDDVAARFQRLENDILKEGRRGGST